MKTNRAAASSAHTYGWNESTRKEKTQTNERKKFKKEIRRGGLRSRKCYSSIIFVLDKHIAFTVSPRFVRQHACDGFRLSCRSPVYRPNNDVTRTRLPDDRKTIQTDGCIQSETSVLFATLRFHVLGLVSILFSSTFDIRDFFLGRGGNAADGKQNRESVPSLMVRSHS